MNGSPIELDQPLARASRPRRVLRTVLVALGAIVALVLVAAVALWLMARPAMGRFSVYQLGRGNDPVIVVGSIFPAVAFSMTEQSSLF